MNAKLNFQSKHKENRLFCALNRPFKTIRHLLLLLATAAAALCPGEAWADEISYLDYDGTLKTVNATKLTSSTSSVTLPGSVRPTYYYVASNDVVTIEGNLKMTTGLSYFNLILCDGASLTVTGYMSFHDIYIFAQSSGDSMGKLIIGSSEDDALIAAQDIEICGGDISVINGGIKCNIFKMLSGRLKADRSKGYAGYPIFNFCLFNATDFFEIKHISDFYSIGKSSSSLNRSYLAHGLTDTTPLAFSGTLISGGELEGKTITLDPSCLYDVTLPASTPGGTVAADLTKSPEGRIVTLSFTPDAGNFLTAASWNNGTSDNVISPASPTTAAYSQTITMPAHDVTVSATFAPAVASITSVSTTTYYLTLSDAFDDIISNGNTSDTYTVKMLRDVSESSNSKSFVGSPTGRNIVIDVNGNDVSYGSITNKYQKLTITDTSTNHDGTMTFGSVSNQGAVAIENVTAYFGSLNNPNSGINDLLSLEKGAATFGTSSSTERTLEWDATRISLDNNSHLIIYSDFYFNQNSNDVTFSIFDTASTVELRECSVGGMKPDKVYNALIDYVQAGKTLVVDGSTKNNLTMRLWDLALDGTNIGNAVVKFFDFGTTEPSASNFNPSLYTADLEIDDINNSDGQDRYILVRLDLAPGCITDKSLLTAYETPIGSTIDNHELNLLLTDNYNAGTVETVIESTRLWYYYKLPGEHHAPDFTKSVVEGDVVPQFNFSTGITQVNDDTNNIHTVTVSRTTDTWTATLTYNKFVWKFDGSVDNEVLPQVQSISICKGGLEKFRLTTRAEIDAQVQHNYGSGIVGISTMKLKPQGVNGGWFISTDEDVSEFTILVPFDGDGSTGNPWQIKTAADLSLLAKCVNVGRCTFEGQDLKLTGTTYDMSGSGFEPIGIDPYQPFMGKLICNGTTIRNITYTYDTPEGLAVTDESPIPTIGLVGNLEGSVENARLESCSFSSESDSENCYVGSIAGFAKSGSVKDCHVIGGNVSAAKTGSYTGAIVGKLGGASLSNNYYDYTTIATLGSSTASGYTKRGICTETISVELGSPSTYDWKDFPTSEGAVLWVKKATINETKPTGSTSSVAFSQKTPGDNCYALDGNDVLYAVGQPITLTVTEGQSKADGIRTFYDGLSSLTVNGSSDGVDLANRSFSMPEADAEIAATFTPSNWFTIPSNGKKWMSFYHEWKDANNAPENYTVSDYNTAGAATPKTIEVKTITAADSKTGEVTFGNLEGVSYSGMPTLFHCETVLPDVLKFTPNTTVTTTVTPATQFIGVAEATQLSGDGIYVMNGDGDFIWASDTSEKLGAHKCYVDLGKAAGRRLTVISDDNATGIHSIDNGPSTMDDADGAWYSIDGRKLQGKPTKKGLYIYKGKKTVIK